MTESAHCLELKDLREDEALAALEIEDMRADIGCAVAPHGDAGAWGCSVIRLVLRPRMPWILVR
jgi:hypothetical protein